MRFADLVVKFSSEGVDKVTRDVNSIEDSLNAVSNAAKKSANAVTSNFNKLKNANASIDRINQSGANFQQTFMQAASAAVPFGDNILDLVQSFALLNKSAESGTKIRDFFENLGERLRNSSFKLVNLRDKFEDFMGKLAQKRGTPQFIKDLGLLIYTMPEMLGKSGSFLAGLGQGIANIAKYLYTVGGAILGIGGALAIATGAVVAFNLAIAKSTVEAAFNFEQLQARLEALKGPSKANDILSFVKRLAEPSNFTTAQLGDSAVQLEAFGLNAKRILPTIAQLGMAFGADAEKLRLLTDMFGRLSQGQLPDVQVMAQFGLSKSKLMKEGIKFDSQGSLVSSTREVFKAIEKIVKREYGGIFDKMAQTGNAKLASLTDVFERLKIGIGVQLAETAKVAVEALTSVLLAIEKQGLFKNLANSMLLPFKALEKVFNADGNLKMNLASFIGTLLAGFEEINIQTAIMIEQLGRAYELVFNPKELKGTEYLQNIGRLISEIGKGTKGQFAPSRMIDKGTDYAMRILGQMDLTGGSDINKLIDESKKTDFGKLEDLLKPAKDKDKKDKERSQRTLDLIQQNTKTQNEITLRNLTYGGGQLAAQGISAVQMSGNRTVSSPQISASNDIVRGIEKIVRGYNNSNNLNFSFRRS